jgi:hypothetical protein
MKIAILKVILWPKDANHSPRIIHFAPGKINILTGESGTGKTTLTWIIDYCLGSDKCFIPVGLIREVTGWFGLHLQLPNTEMLVARRNPEEQQSTSDIYWAEGLSLTIPPIIVEKNARVDDLKNRFNQIADLPNLDFSTGDNVGYKNRPSFRDMAAFNFQPQHIVANPYTMFFKADTTEHREKLTVIFPFVLGAITASTLATQRELKDADRECERLRRELDARLNAAHAWEAEVESYYLQARGLGLLPNTPSPEQGWPMEKYISELRKVPETVRTLDLPDIQQGTNEAAVKNLTALINEEDFIGQNIGSIRRRLGKLDQLSFSVGEYSTSLTSQDDRLLGVGWFKEKVKNTHECPVCAAVHPNGNSRLEELLTLATELKDLTAAVHQAPAKLDQELADLRKQLRAEEAAISKVRQKRKHIEAESNEIASQRQRVRQIYLFVGRVEQALENVRASSNVEELRGKVKLLTDKIIKLKQELDPSRQRERINAAISKVSAKIAEYAALLKLEHSAENVKLNIRDLTLQFSPLSGRTDYLWEVGSGQNWVGYHIACLLALHEHFIGLGSNPVPTFLIIDQPSQVYFPEAWPSIEQAPSGQKKIDVSADIEGVCRIFRSLSHFLNSMNGNFQIIVTEHAGSITWDGIPNVYFVGNWRNGHDEFLIPPQWITAKSSQTAPL